LEINFDTINERMPNLSHKIRLYPNKKQERFFARSCGCSRFVYNWALVTWKQEYETGNKPNYNKLAVKLPELKAHNEWLNEVSSSSLQRAIRNLDSGFKRFFKKKAKYPNFKKRGQRDSFYLTNQGLNIQNKKLKIPKVGLVNLAEPLRLNGKIMGAVISRTADKWFVSINVELQELPKQVPNSNKIIGLDLGINSAIATSDGLEFKSPKPLKSKLELLKRRSRQHLRKARGSNNRKKSQLKLSKLHAKIANIRKDWTHKITSKLIDENQVVCLEDLNVKGMVQNHKLARSLSDVSLGEIRRQLEYKAALYGRQIRYVNRFFPSSKTCSNCGTVKESLGLETRTFNCQDCGFEIGRDWNAAINIKNTAGYAGINAWGDYVQSDKSMNQESSHDAR
jgi:putative transposase